MEAQLEFDETKWNSMPFLETTWKMEDDCAAITGATLPKLGTKAPLTLPAVARVLSYLDAAASCGWGCRGGDHALEKLVFRMCNRARGAIRLLRLGFYDESLMLSRASGENANLLMLFLYRPAAVEQWRAQEKWTTRPVEVRKALEDCGVLLPVDEQRYRFLSAVSAHADPTFPPAAHNVLTKQAGH